MKVRILVLLLTVALAACGDDGKREHAAKATGDVAAAPAGSAQAPARVETAVVASESLTAVVAASGTIEAKRLTEVGTDVPGTLDAVFVDVGHSVKAGAPLFRVDPGPYEMALAEARAGLALARAESANAATEAARMAKLVEENAASVQRADQIRTQAEVAAARVVQGEARVARAERDLARTTVRAPYAGSVVERRAHEGALAGAAPVLVLQESGALEAILDVPETTPITVRAGHAVRLFAQGVADPIVTEVTRVSERIDPSTRTYEVRCLVRDASGAVKAGSYARAEITATRESPQPVAPRSAVVTRDGRSYVLRVERGVAREVPVRVGIATETRVELLALVAPGDVVVHGEAAQRLSDGTRVDAAAPGAAAPVVAQNETQP
ncbi:MAG: efflux RND transporter periplasmic adaptor subunit [Deltaproteobacteria bacterium]|nr:efflux RND transporter periplasmic adaptor subunit [Deltaproteobacteria bacterium]